MGSDNEYSLTINASTANLAKVRQFVAKHAADFGYDDIQIADIRLAVDEACTNIVKHAYEFDDSKQVEIKLSYKEPTLWISLKDSGITFDRKIYRKPDLYDHIRKKKKGGVGVYLIEKHMDDVEYLKTDTHNIIRMCKRKPGD